MLSGVRICWAKAGKFHINHDPIRRLADGAIKYEHNLYSD